MSQDDSWSDQSMMEEDSPEWEAWDAHWSEQHESWLEGRLQTLGTVGVLQGLSPSDQERVALFVDEALRDLSQDASDAIWSDKRWRNRRAKWATPLRKIVAARRKAVKAIEVLAKAVESLTLADPDVEQSISVPCLKRCAAASARLNEIKLGPPRRRRAVPGRTKTAALVLRDRERLEALFKLLKRNQQEAEVRAAKICNAYWGLQKPIRIRKDYYGNERVFDRARARTRKRAVTRPSKGV